MGRVGNGTYESVVARALQFQQFETAELRMIEVPELSALGVAFVNGTNVELVDALGDWPRADAPGAVIERWQTAANRKIESWQQFHAQAQQVAPAHAEAPGS